MSEVSVHFMKMKDDIIDLKSNDYSKLKSHLKLYLVENRLLKHDKFQISTGLF